MITLDSIRAKIAQLTPAPTRVALTVLVDSTSGLVIDVFQCDSNHGVVLHEEPVPNAHPHIGRVRKVLHELAL